MNSKKKTTSAVAQDKGVISAKNAESTPTIGIVIPIYNVAKYLRECLDSVINQSYENFHAVLVNDGSNDDSLKIAMEYVVKDSRFVIIDKKNGGLSSARNAGIAWFNGEMDSSLQNSMNRVPLSSLRESRSDSKQSTQNDLHEVQTESRPIRGAKNRNQTSSSASADFLLEKELLGTPPKSEKAAAFWRVGGAGREVQPFLRKKTGDSISKKIVGDSRIAQMDCHESLRDSRNENIFLDSSLRATRYAQNDEIVDCHDSTANLTQSFRHTERSEVSKSHESNKDNESMTKGQIDKSRRFTQNQQITNDSQIAKVDSSLTAFAQNDESLDSPNLSQKDEEFVPRIDYIIFLDSDDFWAVDLLKKCVDSAQITQNNPDIIWFDWNEIYDVSGKIQGRTTMELFGFTTQTQITATQWLQRAKEREILQFWWAWKGLIRFDYLRRVNLRFLEGVIFEDNLFGVLLFSQCESIAIVPRKLYNYRIRSGSTTNSTKSLPPFVAPLKAHFSTDSEAWAYFCAYSLCEMSLEFANFCANRSEKNCAKPSECGESKLCESIFLPNFLAESCDILAFGSDPLNAKSRFITLLKQRGKYSPYLKIIAHIVPRRFKRLRFALFLFYFAPKVAFFRTMRKILKTLRICRG